MLRGNSSSDEEDDEEVLWLGLAVLVVVTFWLLVAKPRGEPCGTPPGELECDLPRSGEVAGSCDDEGVAPFLLGEPFVVVLLLVGVVLRDIVIVK